ncbi:cobalamin B12-binding domain-containing protein [Chondromyces crocatus]|uniref:Cobalamin-binding protein n=1 Tax=Chondromyces crocatus TaxID=52 RepID=A0A0K1E8K0_CHOCO|nr:cobalamin-dependent protein [Chondromyces crocatus]AKT36908.1 cobalamin-binding protein [Chondromyces crocatus]
MTASKQPDLVTDYLDAILVGNRGRAVQVVEEALKGGMAVRDIHLGVIQEAQYEIGRRWQENLLTVAQEHLATAVSQLVLSHLYRHLPRSPRNGKRILLACVEGEQHEMGARIMADLLEAEGFEVRLLGSNVPTDHLVSMAAEMRPDLVALSASMSFHLEALRRAVSRLRLVLGPRVPILAGGRAVLWTPGIEEQLGVPPAPKDANGVVEAVCTLLRVDLRRTGRGAVPPSGLEGR